MIYQGSCHCGKIAFEVEGEISGAMACNCPTCGIHPYAEGVDPKGERMAAVNLRCVEEIDLASIPVQHFDGRSM